MIDKDVRAIRAEIERIDTLPTIPTILKKLLSVIENPKASLSTIGSFVSNDPVLTSRVLRMVNSPLYGFPGRISSVNQALILLGLNVVRGLLLGVSVFEAMQKAMFGLWEHSLGTAVAARIIAKRKKLSEPEEVSVAALLHDLGKVAFSLKFPAEYENLLKDVEDRSLLIVEGEKEFFGVTHADAGAWVAKRWNFPPNLIEIIEYHHKPHLAKNFGTQAAVVHLADILIRARGFGFAGDSLVPHLNQAAWYGLGLTENDLKDMLSELEESLAEASDFVLSDD
ncbi:MAG TPA: HDOD domain-containing protein [Dissulfurispiraceae bacterium]|nr:HDOD domain-containing protein [Dissulfurispiraceae bacterium]